MSETISSQLAAWCCQVNPSDIPIEQHQRARLRILDTIGLVLAALNSLQGETILRVVYSQGERAESSVIGSGKRLPATWAAFAHAGMAHCFDFDDTFTNSIVHPGSVIVPVALAVGEATAGTGQDITTAITVGYEVAARIGGAAARHLHAQGFHASSVIGPLAAAVTAARLYQLDQQQTAWACGIAGSMSGGLLEFLTEGAWTKWFHLGWAAHGGILAAQCARNGMRGPLSVLEGRYGLYRAFVAGDVAIGSITKDLGKEWRGSAAEFKYYPCAHVIQPYVDALLEFRNRTNLSTVAISTIRCTVPGWCVPLVCEPRAERLRPQNELQAIASLPYILATALVKGTVTIESISNRGREDFDVLDLAKRIFHVEDPQLQTEFSGKIDISTTDGRLLTLSTSIPSLDDLKVRAKFQHNAETTCERDRIAAIEGALDDADFEIRDLASLYRLESAPVRVNLHRR